VATWIPYDPDDFLEKAHFDPAYGRPVDWQINYAPWRYCYAPGFRRIALTIIPGINCSMLQRGLAPFVSTAARLVPDSLKSQVSAVQPDDWTRLPPEQIRNAWSTENMGFAKIVLALIALQVLALVEAGATKRYATLENGVLADPDGLFQFLVNLNNFRTLNVFDKIKLHLATYSFTAHDEEFWNHDVLAKPNVVSDFRNYTGQFDQEFLSSFADGELVTIQTLISISAWTSNQFPNIALGRITYHHKDLQRVRAARKESVKDVHGSSRKGS
jgi:hypothetical protein